MKLRFPTYKPQDNKFSIWSESYGGHYGPAFASLLQSKNNLVASCQLNNALPLHLDTLGIISPFVDLAIQGPYYPQMAFNNTYNLKTITQSQFDVAIATIPACEGLAASCHSAASALDPDNIGVNDQVNYACEIAFGYCFQNIYGPYITSGVRILSAQDVA